MNKNIIIIILSLVIICFVGYTFNQEKIQKTIIQENTKKEEVVVDNKTKDIPVVNQSKIIELNKTDNGKEINIAKGQTFVITLGNPGDGGYSFDTPSYDKSYVVLEKQTHTPPKDSKIIGNFGTDSWTFKSIQVGNSPLKITAKQPWDGGNSIEMISLNINVVN